MIKESQNILADIFNLKQKKEIELWTKIDENDKLKEENSKLNTKLQSEINEKTQEIEKLSKEKCDQLTSIQSKDKSNKTG